MDNNLLTLLEYQELDLKLHRLVDSLDKSDANKKKEQARNEFNAAKKAMQDSEKEAESVTAAFDQTSAQIKEYPEKIKELGLIIENAENADDLKGLSEQLEAYKAKVVALEKKLGELKAAAERLLKSYQEAASRALKMKEIFNGAKSEYDAMKQSLSGQIEELKTKLKETEKKTDPELMAKYKTITAENKFPAFVEVFNSDGEFSCSGCGLQLSQKNKSVLNEKNICTCETCRRIIYKKS